ncbi:MAG: D-alanine--D-alanine ligase family protein [bacterium]|nr:D-alanine--D-alanine ligase family protein [bacterium]MDZ4248104.1 D-alanine--D-alanine ligase family protein [Patescibacteria group bacterium]
MKVIVIGGGRSSEHDVSLQSAAAVREGLREAGHEVHYVEIAKDGTWRHGDEGLPVEPGKGLLGADVVFPVLHGPYGEDGTVQGMLELIDVPYVGSGLHASATCMDKAVFKEWMAHHDVPQVEFVTLRHPVTAPDRERIGKLGWPVFVKPSRLGSSVGIGKAGNPEELETALKEAFEHDSVVLVEQGSSGREVEVGILGVGDLAVSEPGEIIVPGDGWYDYETKYTPGAAEVVIPADLPKTTVKKTKGLAEQAFRATGCSGMARVDFFVENERVLVSEINTIPGFTQTSAYPRLMETAGVAFPDLLNRLLEDARADFRAFRSREH